MINAKTLGMLFAAFVVGSFVASPELRAFAANTVGSADIIDESILSADIKNGEVKTADLGGNSVTAAKIKDGEVKAAEIATDAVGAAELQGVTKLLFAHCDLSSTQENTAVQANSFTTVSCNISGVDVDDDIIATAMTAVNCFVATSPHFKDGTVFVTLRNVCTIGVSPGNSYISIIVYDK